MLLLLLLLSIAWSELQKASDHIDGANRNNAHLLKPLQEEIRQVRAALEEARAAEEAAIDEATRAAEATAAAEGKEKEARAAAAAAEATATAAAAEAAAAREELVELEECAAEEVETRVAQGTRALGRELDEAYERQSELVSPKRTQIFAAAELPMSRPSLAH